MSRLIKSTYAHSENTKEIIIGIKPLLQETTNEVDEPQENKFDLEKYKIEAANILNEAEKKAQKIRTNIELQLQEAQMEVEKSKKNWEIEKEKLMEQTKQESFQLGYDDGYKKGYQEFISHINLAQEIVNKAKEDQLKQIQKSDHIIFQLAMKAAEKIVKSSLKENEAYFLEIVSDVIKDACDHSDISIHVSPVYYNLVLSQKEELQALCTQPNQIIYVYANEQLSEDSCMVETSFGRIDASVDSQLEEIKAKLLQLLEDEDEQ